MLHIIQTNYHSEKLDEAIQELSERMNYVDSLGLPVSPSGPTKSTVFAGINIRNIPAIQDVEQMVLSQLSTMFSNPVVTKSWLNIMYKDSSVGEHKHDANGKYSGVAVLYVKAPVDSAVFQYKIDESFQDVDVNEGMLLVHGSDVVHRVSVHNSNEPRVCIVFNFKYDRH